MRRSRARFRSFRLCFIVPQSKVYGPFWGNLVGIFIFVAGCWRLRFVVVCIALSRLGSVVLVAGSGFHIEFRPDSSVRLIEMRGPGSLTLAIDSARVESPFSAASLRFCFS